ncbi:MAG: hypothetical protein FWH38_04110 [Treponema sp.]|nr:hypothetical protein [Treponema sp.]
MKIIMLAGEPNTGKTTTLNLLYNQLTDNGRKNIVKKRKRIGNEGKGDFQCVVGCGGKSAAIFSKGDVLSGITNAILQYAHCDILILAYNTCFSAKLDEAVRESGRHRIIRKIAPTDGEQDRVIGEIKRQLSWEGVAVP